MTGAEDTKTQRAIASIITNESAANLGLAARRKGERNLQGIQRDC
ncbi:MAG: hypothetical protein PHT15_03155 [Gallionellaceae bacterium]|nr:hypothetical protein [Gallionellaceae bacterium]